MAELYSFHVAVKEMEDKIWRDIDISAKSTLAPGVHDHGGL